MTTRITEDILLALMQLGMADQSMLANVKQGIENVVRQAGKRAGITNAHPHRLRRTCATLALRRGMPIEQVSKMLGHSSIETTLIYANSTMDEVKASHEKYLI